MNAFPVLFIAMFIVYPLVKLLCACLDAPIGYEKDGVGFCYGISPDEIKK